jgi:hypothetical protein
MRSNHIPAPSDRRDPEREPTRDRRDKTEGRSEVVSFPIRRSAAADRPIGPDAAIPAPRRLKNAAPQYGGRTDEVRDMKERTEP